MSAQPDLIDRLRLIRTPGIGPIAYRQLLLRFGSAAKALSAIPDLAGRGGGTGDRHRFGPIYPARA